MQDTEQMEKPVAAKVAAFKCPNCGAAADPDATSCLYCRARLSTRVCQTCFHAVAVGMRHCPHCGALVSDGLSGPEAEVKCLRCGSALETHAVGEYGIPVCPRCGGCWLGKQTFHDICVQADMQKLLLEHIFPEPPAAPPAQQVCVYVPCPECGRVMNRKTFAHGSGVIIDWCSKHGVWLDRQELHRIVEFIRKDGMRRHHKHKQEEMEERAKRLLFMRRTEPAILRNARSESQERVPTFTSDPLQAELTYTEEKIRKHSATDPLKQIFKHIFGEP